MTQKIGIQVFLFITEIVTFLRWSSCWLFQDTFYFTFQNLSTNLLIASNEEKGLPILLIRILHNKVTGFVWGIAQTFLQYIDIRFLYELLGIAGALSIYAGFWYFLVRKPKNLFLWFGIVLVFLLSVVEMVFLPHIAFSKRIIPFTLVMIGFSLFGTWEFLKGNNQRTRFGIIIFFVIVSLLSLLLFPHSLHEICLKV